MRSSYVVLAIVLAGCGQHEPAPAGADGAMPWDLLTTAVDAAQPSDLSVASAYGPILFVHGISGSADDFGAMIDRFTAAGWPKELLFAHTFADPKWGCNVDNAAQISGWVDEVRTKTGADKITIIAHSMGTLSSRFYLERLGGGAKVASYVTLGGMHHGLASACSPDFPFKPCVWTEICSTGAFVADLNTDPMLSGPLHWVSIYGTGDTTVPNDSSILTGAIMVAVPGATHMGLLAEQPGYDAARASL
jgi:triacylglycerol lipase